MELQEFRKVIGRMTVYFDRKMPSEASIALWHEQIQFIPIGALDSIYNQITSQDLFPKNIGNAFRDAWGVYKSANPGKIIRSYGDCGNCHGQGHFEVLKFNEDAGRKIKSVIRCGSCENWMQHWATGTGIGIATKQQLEQRGYEIAWPKAPVWGRKDA